MTEALSKHDFGMYSWCEKFLDFVERPAPPRGRFRTVPADVFRAALEDANSGMIAGDWSLERWDEAETVEDASFWHDVILTRMIQRHCREHYGERLLEIVVGEQS